jgi:hypothetical protein
MREVLTNRKYLQDKLRAVGGPGAELVSWKQDENGVAVVLHHAVPEEALPSALRSVLPDDLTIRRPPYRKLEQFRCLPARNDRRDPGYGRGDDVL